MRQLHHVRVDEHHVLDVAEVAEVGGGGEGERVRLGVGGEQGGRKAEVVVVGVGVGGGLEGAGDVAVGGAGALGRVVDLLVGLDVVVDEDAVHVELVLLEVVFVAELFVAQLAKVFHGLAAAAARISVGLGIVGLGLDALVVVVVVGIVGVVEFGEEGIGNGEAGVVWIRRAGERGGCGGVGGAVGGG